MRLTMVLGFQTDSTRVTSFWMAHDGSNRNFKEIGVCEGRDNLSHHKTQARGSAGLGLTGKIGVPL